MTLVQGLLKGAQRMTCHHQWVRARWHDGSYGLRCASCMKPYPHTWDEILAAPIPGRISKALKSPTPALDSKIDDGLRAA